MNVKEGIVMKSKTIYHRFVWDYDGFLAVTKESVEKSLRKLDISAEIDAYQREQKENSILHYCNKMLDRTGTDAKVENGEMAQGTSRFSQAKDRGNFAFKGIGGSCFYTFKGLSERWNIPLVGLVLEDVVNNQPSGSVLEAALADRDKAYHKLATAVAKDQKEICQKIRETSFSVTMSKVNTQIYCPSKFYLVFMHIHDFAVQLATKHPDSEGVLHFGDDHLDQPYKSAILWNLHMIFEHHPQWIAKNIKLQLIHGERGVITKKLSPIQGTGSLNRNWRRTIQEIAKFLSSNELDNYTNNFFKESYINNPKAEGVVKIKQFIDWQYETDSKSVPATFEVKSIPVHKSTEEVKFSLQRITKSDQDIFYGQAVREGLVLKAEPGSVEQMNEHLAYFNFNCDAKKTALVGTDGYNVYIAESQKPRFSALGKAITAQKYHFPELLDKICQKIQSSEEPIKSAYFTLKGVLYQCAAFSTRKECLAGFLKYVAEEHQKQQALAKESGLKKYVNFLGEISVYLTLAQVIVKKDVYTSLYEQANREGFTQTEKGRNLRAGTPSKFTAYMEYSNIELKEVSVPKIGGIYLSDGYQCSITPEQLQRLMHLSTVLQKQQHDFADLLKQINTTIADSKTSAEMREGCYALKLRLYECCTSAEKTTCLQHFSDHIKAQIKYTTLGKPFLAFLENIEKTVAAQMELLQPKIF